MILTLREVVKYNRPFRAVHRNTDPRAHSYKNNHNLLIPDPKGMDGTYLRCVTCWQLLYGIKSLETMPDEWILDIDDDDSHLEENAKDILSKLGIKLKEGELVK